MRRLVGAVVVSALGFLLVMVSASSTNASTAPIDLLSCDGTTLTVLKGETLTLTGPTFIGKNKGSIEDFLNANTTTLATNDVAANTSASWTAPAQRTDATLGAVWATSWQRQVSAPPVGAPAALTLRIVLSHSIPDLTVPAKSRPVFFTAGEWKSGRCTLLTGQPIDPAVTNTVTTADNNLNLTVPPHATTTDTTITVQPSTAIPPADLGTPAAPTYDLGPTGTTFTTPVTVAIGYDALPPGATIANLHVATYSSANNKWRLLPTTVDPATHTLTTHTTHFSLFTGSATPGYDLVSGTLTDSAGHTVPAGVVATAIDQNGSVVATDATDDVNPGIYSLLVPDRGTYRFRFVAPTGVLLENIWLGGTHYSDSATRQTITGATTVNVTLPNGIAFTGYVKDSTGAGVAGGTVRAVSSTPACCTPYTDVTTASDGSYWLVVQPGWYKIRAGADANATTPLMGRWYPNALLRQGAIDQHLDGSVPVMALSDVTLSAGVRLSGTVLDSAGHAVVGASVAALGTSPSCCAGYGGNGVTDANGHYALVAPAGPHLIQFSPPAGAALGQQFYDAHALAYGADVVTLAVGSDRVFDQTLPPGVLVSGRVTDTATPANGIGNVFVGANMLLPNGSCCIGTFGATTDASGAYQFYLAPATYRFYAAPLYGVDFLLQAYPSGTDLGAAPEFNVSSPFTANFALSAGYPIAGTVRDAATGAPISGANVSAQLPPPPNGCCPQFVNSASTAGDGGFRFAVPANTYILRAQLPSTSPLLYVAAWYGDGNDANAATHVVVGPGSPAAPLSLTLQPGFVISGIVRDAVTHAAITSGNVQANLYPAGGQCCTNVGGSQIGTDGSFRIVVPAGAIILRINQPTTSDYLSTWWGGGNNANNATQIAVGPATPNAGVGLTLDLAKGFVISGTVRDAVSFSGLANAGVSVLLPPPGGKGNVAFANSASDGKFRMVVPAGSYRIFVTAPSGSLYVQKWYGDGFDSNLAALLTVNDTSPNAGVGLMLDLETGFVISGSVRDATTLAAVTTGFVNANLPPAADGSCCVGAGNSAVGGDGTFRIVVAAGTYVLNIFEPNSSPYIGGWFGGGNDPRSATPITVDAAHPSAGLGTDIRLQRGFHIGGTVFAAGTRIAVGGVPLSVQVNPTDPRNCCQWVAGTQSNPDGTFSFFVAPGSYVLNVGGGNSEYVARWYNGNGNAGTGDTTQATVISVVDRDLSGYELAAVHGFHIRGTVYAAGTSNPLGGVGVGANVAPTSQQSCCIGVGGTRTDNNGAFSLIVAPGDYVLNVGGGDSNYVFRWYAGNDNSGTQDVMVATRITVTDGDRGGFILHAIPGVHIRGTVYQTGTTFTRAGVQVGASIAPVDQQSCCIGAGGAQSSADGRFSFVVAPGLYVLSVGGGDSPYVFEWWDGGSGTLDVMRAFIVDATLGDVNDLTVEATPGVHIRGTVRDASGNPLGDVPVNVNLAPASNATCCTGVGGTRSDASTGTYSVTVAPGLAYVLSVGGGNSSYVHRWYAGNGAPGTGDVMTATRIPLASADVTGIDPQATLGYRISGQISDGAGHPVTADVNVFDATGSCLNAPGGGTDMNGNFDFAIPAGSWKILFNPDRTNTANGTLFVQRYWGSPTWAGATIVTAIAGGTQGGLNAVLAMGVAITGQVVSAASSGTGIENVGVAANATDPSGCGDWAANTSTNASGNFRLVVSAGTYRLFANGQDQGFVNSWLGGTDFNSATPITAPSSGETIALQPGLRITGHVTDAVTTLPLANAEVNVTTSPDGCCFFSGARTNTSGDYSVIVPGGGPYYVQFSYPNVTTAYVAQLYNGATTFGAATPVTGAGGTTRSGIDAALATGVLITGTARTTGGTAIAGLWVSAFDGGATATCCQGSLYNARTDGAGLYRLAVPSVSGPFRVGAFPDRGSIYLPAYYSTTNPGTADFFLATDVAAPASSIDITLSNGLHIRGTVTSGGVGVAGANVQAHRLDASGRCCIDYANAQTGPDGSYDLTVSSGTWRLRFVGSNASHLVGTWYPNADDFSNAADVVVSGGDRTGINASLASGVWISGRVLRPNGTPAANVGVQAQVSGPCCKWSPMENWTDATGTFHVAVPANATYHLQVNPNEQVLLLLGQWYSTTTLGTRDPGQATDIPIAASDVSIGDLTLVQGYAIHGHVTVDGTPASFVNVTALDATTGAWRGNARTEADGSYDLIAPASSVKLAFDVGGPQTWYGGIDFASATALTVPGMTAGRTFDMALVTSLPVAALSASPNPAACTANVFLDGSASHSASGIVIYRWDFGDGTSYTETASSAPDGSFDGRTTHAYAQFQTYAATLTVTDGAGRTAAAQITVTVNQGNHPPLANVGGPYSADLDSSLVLDATGSSEPDAACGDRLTNYSWTIGTFLFATSSPTFTLSSAQVAALGPGAFTVQLAVVDTFGASSSASTTLNIYINRPVASFTASPNPAACNQTITFDGSGSYQGRPDRAIVRYDWNFDDGSTASGPIVTHFYAAFRSYNATLVVTDSNTPPKTATMTQTIAVNLGNLPPVASAGGPYTVDLGATLTLDGTASSDPNAGCGDSIVSYSWLVAGSIGLAGPSPTLTSAQINALGAGSFAVSLIVVDTFGASSSAATTLNIYDNRPVASFTASPNPAACTQAIAFDASASRPGRPDRAIVGYSWDFGDGVTGSGVTMTHAYATFRSYTVTMTVTDNNTPPKTATMTQTIAVNLGNLPPVASSGGPYTVNLGQSLTLDGSGSSDPNAGCGDSIQTYTWFIPKTTATLTGPRPTLSADQITAIGVGTFPVSLTVIDMFGAGNTVWTEITIN